MIAISVTFTSSPDTIRLGERFNLEATIVPGEGRKLAATNLTCQPYPLCVRRRGKPIKTSTGLVEKTEVELVPDDRVEKFDYCIITIEAFPDEGPSSKSAVLVRVAPSLC